MLVLFFCYIFYTTYGLIEINILYIKNDDLLFKFNRVAIKNSSVNYHQEMEDSKQSEEEYEETIRRLWTVIKSAGKEKREKIVASLDQKTITALRTYNNPYKKPVIAGDKYRFLAFNVINMTEKYAQRFAMTGLIGFIYRMLEEYKPESDYISEDDIKFSGPYNQKVRNLILTRPEELLTAELDKLRTQINDLRSGPAPEIRKLVKESFIVRAKIIKYRSFLVREDQKANKTKLDLADKDVRTKRSGIQYMTDKIKSTEIRITKLKEPESGSSSGPGVATPESGVPAMHRYGGTEVPARKTEDEIRSLEEEIVRIREAIEKYKTSLASLETKLNLATTAAESYNMQILQLNAQFRNLKSEYDSTFPKSGKTSSGFLDSVEVDKYEPNGDELDAFAEEVKKELGITKTAEEYMDEVRDIIQAFLDMYFKYNPDTHVKCAYKPNYDDPSRIPLKTDKSGNINEETIERSVIPPDDTFYRWNRYVENNYEPLRQACDDIYAEKSDFEFDLVPLEIFEGDTQDEAEEKFNQFKRKYADEFEADIYSARFASHNLLSPWYQNRQVRDFYTERTEIIKRILDQNKEDAKYGQKIIKERAKQKKSEDIKKLGPDPVSRKQYLAANPPKELETHGAIHMDKLEAPDIIKPGAIPKDLEDSTQKEVEVDVHVIRPQIRNTNGRRRVRGFAEQWKFNIPAEPLKEGDAIVRTPAETIQS